MTRAVLSRPALLTMVVAAAVLALHAGCAGPEVRRLPGSLRGARIAVFEPRNATGRPQRENRYVLDANLLAGDPKPALRGTALLRALLEEGLRNRGFVVISGDVVDRIRARDGRNRTFVDVLRDLRREGDVELAFLSVVYEWDERLSDIEPAEFTLDTDVLVVATDTGEPVGALRGFHWSRVAQQEELLENYVETYAPGAGTWYVRRFVRDALDMLLEAGEK